jgi:hypothetical protein
MCKKSSTDKVDPNVLRRIIETEEQNREKPLIDKDDAQHAKSKTDNENAKHILANSDRVEPPRHPALSEMDAPKL